MTVSMDSKNRQWTKKVQVKERRIRRRDKERRKREGKKWRTKDGLYQRKGKKKEKKKKRGSRKTQKDWPQRSKLQAPKSNNLLGTGRQHK